MVGKVRFSVHLQGEGKPLLAFGRTKIFEFGEEARALIERIRRRFEDFGDSCSRILFVFLRYQLPRNLPPTEFSDLVTEQCPRPPLSDLRYKDAPYHSRI